MTDKTVIVDYDSGNLHSAEKAFARAAADIGEEILVSAEPEDVLRAERVVLPGVGAFGDCAAGLHAARGLWEAIEQRVVKDGRPFFGICVGMQLMAERGLERGAHRGFGWIPGDVVEIERAGPEFKIPHMGWNKLDVATDHPVLATIPDNAHAYFVHSFHLRADNPDHILARTTHGVSFAAAVGRDNLIGTQFHPEKSQEVGQALIRAFLKWRP
ncbi:MAG: imidazole glycerol phosphate synthase subunit HisH [Neomegalonema sp.]|nr:imidazole glycerol phosphate synthase subunit HisH [Neomegalonema sp.]